MDITGLNPGTTYYFTCTSYVDNLGWGTSYNVQATTNIKTASDILNPYIIPNETAIVFDSPNYTSDGKNFKSAGRRITSVSGDDMYTNGTTPITVNTHSKAMGYISFYGMSSTDAAAIDSIASQLNASYNRLKLYDRSREADAWKIVSTNKGLDVFAVIKFYSNCVNESTKKYELYMSIVEMRTSGGTLDRDPCVFPDTGNGFYWMHFFKE